MRTKSIEKCLWVSAVLFITYLFLGSFIISKDFIDLSYLVILYSFILSVKIKCRNK